MGITTVLVSMTFLKACILLLCTRTKCQEVNWWFIISKFLIPKFLNEKERIMVFLHNTVIIMDI